MQYWLIKSEPSAWSWQNQVDRGDAGEPWDGVRNHQASNNMKAMEIGDLIFFYHSVHEKRIVGIAEVCAKYHPDPTDDSGRFGMASIRAVKTMNTPLTLAQIKNDKRLSNMALVRQSRLSIAQVLPEHWDIIMGMGNCRL